MDIKPEYIKRILVIRTDRLGDVVVTTPALKALRQGFMNAHIAVLATEGPKALLENNPYIQEIIIDDRKGIHKSWFLGFLNLVRLIRQKQFDVAIIYHTKRRYNLAAFLAGIPIRLGYKDKNFGFLLTHPIKDNRHLGLQHESKNCLDVLRLLGIDEAKEDALHLRASKESITWAQQWVKENVVDGYGLVLIHPGASDTTRRWPKESFIKLIDQIQQLYQVKVAIIGDSMLKDLALSINAGLQYKAYDLTGKTTLIQLMGLMTLSRLVVSNDSGPAHVASGLGVPVISIFLRSQPGLNATRWHLKGPYSITITPSKETGVELDRDLKIIKGSLDAIAVEDVMQAVAVLWRRYEQNQFLW